MKRCKQIISLLVILCMLLPLLPLSARAEASGTCGDNLTWNFDTITGHLTISGTGAMTDFKSAGAPWYEYCSQILSVTIPEGVTNIGDYAFYNCEEMTAAGVPDSVTRIGDGAFCYCESLEEIHIPQGVTYIGARAFRWCQELTQIHIPDSVTTIADSAFSDCANLQSVVIPDSVTTLGKSAFSGCKYMGSVTLPKGITVISDSLFSNCWFLDNVVIPEGVTRIDTFAFYNCYYMTNITIPDTVTEIAGGAFAECRSITRFTIPDGVTAIRDSTFSGCYGLESVTIPNSVTVIEEEAFYECENLTNIVIPDSVTSIGLEAFARCTSLSRITIPNSVTSLGESAFESCGSLTEVTLSNNLTAICKETFNGAAIKKLTLPESIVSIENFAFFGANELREVVFLGDAPVFGTNGASDYVFCDLTLTAYYPENNDTWTEEVMQQYGGTITWVCGDGTEAEAPAADLNWTFSEGVLTISGNGGMGDYTQTTMPWYAHKSETTSIVVEEGITSIGSWAFCQFGKVESVSIPETVTRIGTYAFYNADGLTGLNIPESVHSIEGYAFSDCNGLSGTLLLPAGVETVGKYAFSECGSLENLRAEAGLLSIGEGAFSDCPELKIVSLPSTLQEIGTFAFGDCTALRQIGVDDANTHYYSQDGVLFTEGAKTLIQYPAGIGGIYNVPQQVTRVENHAFRGCGSLQWVVFPGDAPTFGQYSFYNTTATVRYPLGNATWTDSVLQQYGGTITWMATDTREPVEAKTIEGKFSYQSNVTDQTASYEFSYDDNWFYGSAKRYNHDLARMSLRMAMSAACTESDNIEDLMDSLGMSYVTTHYPTPTVDTIGYAIGSKKIVNSEGETITLIAVAVRGGGYGAEWGSNVLVGSGGDHQGFDTAADEVTAAVKEYIANIGADENVRIWITGFSRAAATANLTARNLNEAVSTGELLGFTPNDIFAYCFACPQGTVDAQSDGNIINIVGGNDLVPLVAPSDWGFSRHGTTYYIPTEATAYNSYVYDFYAMRDEYIAILKQAYLEADTGTLAANDENTAIAKASAEALKLTSFFEDHDLAITEIVNTVSSVMSRTEYCTDFQTDVVNAFGSASSSSAFGIGDAINLFFDCKTIVEYFKEPGKTVLGEIKGYLLPSPLESIGAAHYPEYYLAWLNYMDSSLLSTQNKTRKLTANCPVDLSVYDSDGKLVAQITGDEVQKIEDSTIIAVVDPNGQKTVVLPFDEEFEIVVTATDDGTMSYQVVEYDIASGDTTRVVNYYDVAITTGDTITGTAGIGTETDAEYTLTDASGEKLTPTNELTGDEVSDRTVTVSSEGNGTVTGGGLYVTGEYAMVTAEAAEGEDFLGWYVNDALVSSDTVFRFRVEQDVQIVGRFTEKKPALDGVIRIAGSDRIATSLGIADQLKETLGVEKFETMIVASALNFPDALTGSYLAAVKSAPILLTYEAAHSKILAYIDANLETGGTVYILGGESAVSAGFESGLTAKGINAKRLAGDDRFGTNLEIMKEAGVSADQPVLIATAVNFADSLSASAAGLPMVLVYGSLRDDQKAFLETTSKDFIIIGGTSAVSESLEAELDAIGSVTRLAGSSRYETSVMVAQRFVPNPDAVVLAYARNFPDGLCGGPLAVALNAPLILTDNYDPSAADAYVNGITAGIVVGGAGLISDDSARAIFDLAANAEIKTK